MQVDGHALTALQLIDDSIFVDNAQFTLTSSSVNVAGGVYQSGTPGTLADNDAGAILLNSTSGQMVELMASTAAIGKVDHSITGGADGVTLVSTAGTDVVLASSTTCKKVDIQAQTDNTGLIAVGFTGVDATEATGTGIILESGDTYSLEINNLNLIYIDSTVSGEGVRYTYYT